MSSNTSNSNEENVAGGTQLPNTSQQNLQPQVQQPAAFSHGNNDEAAFLPPNENERVVLPFAPSPYQDPQELAALNRVRSCATASIVCGIISLFVCGVALSSIAIVFSLIGYRTITRFMHDKHSSLAPAWKEQQARIRIALIISICAFVLSILALIFLYPLMIEFLQTNGFDFLPFGGETSGGSSAGSGSNSGSSGSSVWG